MSWDVVVVGYGYAGAMAAIEAHDAGAQVLVLEKMADTGGVSICSAGGVRIAFDAESALDYLEAANAGTTPTPVLAKLAEGMVELPNRLRALAQVNAARVEIRAAKGNYPFRGHESFGFAMVEDVPGFSPEAAYPCVRGSPAGARLFKVVEDNVRERGIEVRLETSARRLLTEARAASPGSIPENRFEPERLSSRAAGSKPTPRCRSSSGKQSPFSRRLFGAIPVTVSGWRKRSARGSGICGTTTALTASGTPTPPILSSSERSVCPIGFQETRCVTTCGCHGFFLIGTAAAS